MSLAGFRRHKPLFLILALFTVLTLYNSAVLPLGEAADETDHYQYLRFVARTGHPPLTEAERVEAGFKGGLAPFYYWLTAWPVALAGQDARPEIRRVDSRPERHIPTDGLGINRVLHTLDEQWPWRGQVLAWHLVRLLSLPMAWVTIIATYALVRRLMPEQKIVAIGAAAFVAFLPRFVISSAVINDDNLVFTLTSLLLLTQIIILQGNHRPLTFAIFGTLFGLSLITKYFSLILMPEILFTIISYQLTISKRSIFQVPVLSFLVALALIAGPWFVFIILRFNRIAELGFIPGLAASLGEPQITEGLVGLLSGQSVRPPAATYTLFEWLGLLYRSFWFEYGWMQIFAPAWIYGLFTLFLLIALAGLIHKIKSPTPNPKSPIPNPQSPTPPGARKSRASVRNPKSEIRNRNSSASWLLGLHLALFAVVVLARYALSATIDTGQGRHLFPALPVIALLISPGLIHFGFRISDFGHLPWGYRKWLSKRFPLSPPAAGYLLPGICFLLPAALTLLPSVFILPHYRTLPITGVQPAELTIADRRTIRFGDGLSLAGFDVAETVFAGDALPVTLYWRAEKEAEGDYLVSLCLHDDAERPVGCWRGHFADGRYPARAWEAGDTLIDTISIPIPACNRLDDQLYNLHLELWPLESHSALPLPEGPPVLRQTFAEPLIAILAGDSRPENVAQMVDVWRAGERLTGPTGIEPREALAQITYAHHNDHPRPTFEAIEQNKTWLPLAQFDTPLYLPCAGGPTPFAHLFHFIAGPDLLPGVYRPDAPGAPAGLTLSLSPRLRALQPGQARLSFAPYLSLLALQLPWQPAINLVDLTGPVPPQTLRITHTTQLPITIRWQARRWMADPLVVSLKLLDKDFMIGGERIATLGDRYPNVLWAPTEVVEETYPLQIRSGAPPGLYRLELSIVHPDKNLPDGFEYLSLTNGQTTLGVNLYPATFRLLDPAHDNPPPQPFPAQLGHTIQLTGYGIKPKSEFRIPNSEFDLVLYWQSRAKITTDYTVFTQLLGPDGQVWAQWDNPPQAGRYPTTAWAKADTVVDRYTLTLRQGAPPGDYRLLVGMYDPTTGQRLPVVVDGQPRPDQAIELTRLSFSR